MKKKRWITIAGCIICIFVLFIAVFSLSGQKPYKNLKASDIVSATVQLTPPGKSIRITEFDELTTHLNDLVIYKKDSSYGEYCGQAITITLTMAEES